MRNIETMHEQAQKLLPPYMVEGIMRYIEYGSPMGQFGQALLSGDLFQAFAHADDENTAAMRNWVVFLYSYAPSGCYRDKQTVKDWIAQGGLRGKSINDN